MVSFSFACALADLGSDMQVPETNRCVILSGPTASKSARTEGAEAWFSSGCDRTDLSDRYEAGGGACFPGTGRQKPVPCCGNLHTLQIDKASAKWTVSIRHGRNIGPTWGQLRPAGPNFGPTWTNWPQVRPSLAPRWHNLAPTNLDPFGSNFGPS